MENYVGVKTRSGDRCQVSGVKARRRGGGGGSWDSWLVIQVAGPEGRDRGFNPGPSPLHAAPDAAPFHDVLETKGVRYLTSKCLKGRYNSNNES
jgi:hypothetical protein